MRHGVALPVRLANVEIVGRLRRDVTPKRVEQAITKALDRYAAESTGATSHENRLRQALAVLDARIARYTAAVDQAPDLPSVLEALRGLQQHRADLHGELAYIRGVAQSADQLDRVGLGAEIRTWLEDWQGLLEEEPAQARQVLRKLFVGRLVWTPRVEAENIWYDYAVQTSYSRVLAGVVGVKGMVPPG